MPPMAYDEDAVGISSMQQRDPFQIAFYGKPPPGTFSFSEQRSSTDGEIPIVSDPLAPTLYWEETPDFLPLSSKYKDKWVLVIGGMAQAREQIKTLGFGKVLISSDLVKESANFHVQQASASIHNAVGIPRSFAEQSHPIAAIFVLNAPEDWVLDLHILLALLSPGDGRSGSDTTIRGSTQNFSYRHNGNPKLYCKSNPEFERPTPGGTILAEGAFLCALKAVWKDKMIRMGFNLG